MKFQSALLLLCCTFACYAQQKYTFTTTINPDNVTIVRDSFGVPHIFGKTDADAAYGLAWANAEDGFEVMQDLILSGKGMMGRSTGKEGAPVDFFVHALGAREIVQDRFYKDLTPEFIRYLEGYCQGINAFAKKYPDRVRVKKAFPVSPFDIVQAYVLSFSALTGVATEVGDVVKGKYDAAWQKMYYPETATETPPQVKEKRKKHDNEDTLLFSPFKSDVNEPGSNGFAMNKNITADGNTYLCINPHMMVEGPLSFYEAHIQSEEGLNITGAIFQCGTSVYMGNNENLGWTHTFNHFDAVDVYALKMNPKHKLQYELDGKYYELEKRPIWLKVKLGKITIPVKKTTYWSEHFGAVFKSKGGKFYAVRGMAFMTVKAAQQFYYMDKARNYKEFKAALDMQGLPMFNVIYADKEGNILFLDNGLIPDRKASYDWTGLIPGNDSKYIWDKAITVDNLPHSLNPECGYVYNMNNTPFNATCEADNCVRQQYPVSVDGRPGENNRSTRFKELINEKAVFTFEDFKQLKFDHKWPKDDKFLESIQPMFDLDPKEYPQIADVIGIINAWDKSGDTNSIGATVIAMAMEPLFEGKDDAPFICGLTNTKEDYVHALEHAKEHLLKYFGTVSVPLGKVQRFVRGDKSYAIPGFPDMLMANYPRKHYINGMFKLEHGDTFIQFVKFTPNGAEHIESLVPYNTLPTAGNYIDQTLMYQKMETKPVTLKKEEVVKEGMAGYHPK